MSFLRKPFFALFISIFPALAYPQPTVEDFIREADYRSAKISPSGRYLAEVWNRYEDNTRIVTVRDLEADGHPIVGKMADSVARPKYVNWANDNRLLVTLDVPSKIKRVIKDSKNKEDFDIYDYFTYSRTIAMDKDGKNTVFLLNDERKIRGNYDLSSITHFLPEEPDHILMSAHRLGALTLFKVNVNTGESERLVRGKKFTYAFITNSQGTPLYRLDYKSRSKVLEIYELNNDKWKRIEKFKLEQDIDENVSRGDLIGIYQNKVVYRKNNAHTGFDELWTYDNKSKNYEVLVSLPDRDVLFAITSLRTHDIIGYAMDGDLIRYKFFEESLQSDYDTLANKVGDYNFRYTSFSEDGLKAVVYQYGQDNPGSLSLYNRATKKLEFLNHRYHPISVNNLSLPASAWYKSRDGLNIRSYILLPKDYQQGTRYPLVVLPHGGPQARNRANYNDFAQFISTRGYVVIQPNFRGSTGYGKAFQEAGYKEWGGKMQDDLADAVRFMVNKGYADPQKVCIVGSSYGGYAALMGAVKHSDIYQCAISINGVTDLPDMINYDKKQLEEHGLIQKYLYERIGHPKNDSKMLMERSPARRAQDIKIPVLIIAGTEDEIVPFKQAKKMVKALKKAKKPYEFLELKDTGHHAFYYKEDIKNVYTKVETFLAKHIHTRNLDRE